MHSVLAYFDAYFQPGVTAPLENHSAGQIARHLHQILQECGRVTYLDAAQRPEGIEADLFIGHFWNYLPVSRTNHFRKKIAFYAVSDPERRRALLYSLAERFGVPAPDWDFPPADFDHASTMRDADLVLLVGNSYTLETFSPEWRPKIRLLNYSVDEALYTASAAQARANEFCYVATQCGLRKGFMDVLLTWSGMQAGGSKLHVIGTIEPPWNGLLARYNNGSILYHGWIDSHSPEYARILQGCKFVYVPTYEEGQMGSLLEAMYCGCVPITTRASGIDDRVLQHSIVIEPLDIEQQRAAILDALGWPEELYGARRRAIAAAVRECHNWDVFARGVKSALAELL